MLKIEEYFNNNKSIDNKIYNNNELFEVENNDLFKILVDINLWANNIRIEEDGYSRPEQKKFRNLIVNRDKKCIVTGKNIANECQACHIISVKERGTYDINNGLLINSIHHKSFDNNLWCINPETLCIDVLIDNEEIVGSIIEYNGQKVNINPNNIMKYYLKKRWEIYITQKYDYYKRNDLI
jgi:hypothetical protein